MAFERKNFDRSSGGGNAPKLFTYKTTDAVATVDGAGYFNDLRHEVDKGDIIHSVSDLGTVPAVKHYVIRSERGVSPVVAA